MPINYSILPKSTPLVGHGGGFGAIGGWGRAFGETLINNVLVPDTDRPQAPSVAKSRPRVNVIRDRPKLRR